ncbi:hypothetical protein OUZ56_000227 [Daphnia magna]|uniref:Uncharacterized protein n=1 Tax=Daphnia magna TaxID=35525 RepID=A0ABQ9ZZ19_9CRUS|nr:hypothetical protein OUZ56_000227 [Daphnia magna]
MLAWNPPCDKSHIAISMRKPKYQRDKDPNSAKFSAKEHVSRESNVYWLQDRLAETRQVVLRTRSDTVPWIPGGAGVMIVSLSFVEFQEMSFFAAIDKNIPP